TAVVIAATAAMVTPLTTAAAAKWPTARRARRGRAGIQRDDAHDLNALAPLADLAMNRRAFRRILKTRILQRRDMQEHIRRAICRRHEAETLLRIKPLDPAFELGATLVLIV